MNLQQTQVLVDRALVTLCAELPESLGLYNTAKDQFTIGAIRSVPMLEHIVPDSKKHYIIRDWMRTYVEHEDQPLSTEISLDTLRTTLKQERKERQREIKRRHKELVSEAGETGSNGSGKDSSKSSKRSASGKSKAKDASTRKSGSRTKPRGGRSRAADTDESEVDSDASSTSTTSSEESSVDLGTSDEEIMEISDDDDDSSSQRRRRRQQSGASKKKSSQKKKSSAASSSKKDSKAKERNDSKKRKQTGAPPPMEVVLSSDEDDETNALFDTDDPDVYEVESIVDKRAARSFGEQDMYLIKWVGYDEPTWEPAENVSKDLIDEYELAQQSVREGEYVVEEIVDRKTVRDKETRLKTFKYLVKWVGYDDQTWEPADNLPHNLRRKFDQKYEARKRRRMR